MEESWFLQSRTPPIDFGKKAGIVQITPSSTGRLLLLEMKDGTGIVLDWSRPRILFTLPSLNSMGLIFWAPNDFELFGFDKKGKGLIFSLIHTTSSSPSNFKPDPVDPTSCL